jgi:hypothetical protein
VGEAGEDPMTASELRAAADTLDRHADAATPGPWQALCDGYGDTTYGRSEDERRDLTWVRSGRTNAGDIVSTQAMPGDSRQRQADAAFIAVMDPALAKTVAALLRAEADCPLLPDHIHRAVAAAAFAVARAVNKEKP